MKTKGQTAIAKKKSKKPDVAPINPSKRSRGNVSPKRGSGRKRAASNGSDERSDASDKTPDRSRKKTRTDDVISDDSSSDIDEVEIAATRNDQVLSWHGYND
jgi:hypothetical protein